MTDTNDLNRSENHLDELTRTRMLKDFYVDKWISQGELVDKITALAFVIGVIVGIVIASLLHKYISHPLGY